MSGLKHIPIENTLKCAVGNTIRVGSYVAYVTQQGGWRSITRRRVAYIDSKAGYLRLESTPNGGRSGLIKPRNCVVVP